MSVNIADGALTAENVNFPLPATVGPHLKILETQHEQVAVLAAMAMAVSPALATLSLLETASETAQLFALSRTNESAPLALVLVVLVLPGFPIAYPQMGPRLKFATAGLTMSIP